MQPGLVRSVLGIKEDRRTRVADEPVALEGNIARVWNA